MYGFAALLLKKEFLLAYAYSKENSTFHGGRVKCTQNVISIEFIENVGELITLDLLFNPSKSKFTKMN